MIGEVIGFDFILLLLCAISYERAKKNKTNPWLCYWIGIAIMRLALLGRVAEILFGSGISFTFILDFMVTVIIAVVFGLMIKKKNRNE